MSLAASRSETWFLDPGVSASYLGKGSGSFKVCADTCSPRLTRLRLHDRGGQRCEQICAFHTSQHEWLQARAPVDDEAFEAVRAADTLADDTGVVFSHSIYSCLHTFRSTM